MVDVRDPYEVGALLVEGRRLARAALEGGDEVIPALEEGEGCPGERGLRGQVVVHAHESRSPTCGAGVRASAVDDEDVDAPTSEVEGEGRPLHARSHDDDVGRPGCHQGSAADGAPDAAGRVEAEGAGAADVATPGADDIGALDVTGPAEAAAGRRRGTLVRD